MIDVYDCVRLEETGARHACYEERAQAAWENSRQDLTEAAPPPASAPAKPRPVPAARVAESYGFPQRAEKDPGVPELAATISELRESVPDRFLITLDNGQVWRQMTSKKYRLEVGQQVRIYPTQWGDAFRLTVEELRGFIQVERIR